eukprot:15365426-Ditylum_brightwellii.AAC.1
MFGHIVTMNTRLIGQLVKINLGGHKDIDTASPSGISYSIISTKFILDELRWIQSESLNPDQFKSPVAAEQLESWIWDSKLMMLVQTLMIQNTQVNNMTQTNGESTK